MNDSTPDPNEPGLPVAPSFRGFQLNVADAYGKITPLRIEEQAEPFVDGTARILVTFSNRIIAHLTPHEVEMIGHGMTTAMQDRLRFRKWSGGTLKHESNSLRWPEGNVVPADEPVTVFIQDPNEPSMPEETRKAYKENIGALAGAKSARLYGDGREAVCQAIHDAVSGKAEDCEPLAETGVPPENLTVLRQDPKWLDEAGRYGIQEADLRANRRRQQEAEDAIAKGAARAAAEREIVRPGDLVYLKGPGNSPAMTVLSTAKATIECAWFNGGEIRTFRFPYEAIRTRG